MTPDGRVVTFCAQVAGTVDDQGQICDAAGHPVGQVRSDGSVFTWPGHYLGYVEPAADTPLSLRGGAALLLLPLTP